MSRVPKIKPYTVTAAEKAKSITRRKDAETIIGRDDEASSSSAAAKPPPVTREPHFTFDEGTPVAIVHGGEHDKQIVCVSEEDTDPYQGADPIVLLGEDWFQGKKRTDGKRLTFSDLDHLSTALSLRDGSDLPEKLIPIYNEALKHFQSQNARELALNEGYLNPLPDCENRECIYVAGPSGSGKSTWCARWCNEFRKLVPEITVYVFSRLKEDPIIDLLKPTRIIIDDEFAKNPPMQPEELANSIVLFDDIDTIQDKKQLAAVTALRNDLLETGRHQNVWVICTGHQLTNYQKTRVILNECTKVTLFPRMASTYHIRRILKEYFGFTPKQITEVLQLPSRWITVTRTAPQMVMHEKGCYLVN